MGKMNKPKTYKSCFVPKCANSTITSPDKIFFFVPQDQKQRKLWFKIARRADQPGNSHYYCCQDHFDIKEDVDNYVQFSLCGGRLKLKQGVTPHIFYCQPDRVQVSARTPRPGFLKLNRKREITQILHEDSENNAVNESKPQADSYDARPNKVICSNNVILNPDNIIDMHSSTSIDCNNLHNVNVENEESCNSDQSHILPMKPPSISSEDSLQPNTRRNSSRILGFGESSPLSSIENINRMQDFITVKNVGVQVEKKLTVPHYRSKSVSCFPEVQNASCQTDKNCCCSKEDLIAGDVVYDRQSTVSSSVSSSITSKSTVCSEYKESTQSEYVPSSTTSEGKKVQKNLMRQSILNVTHYFISTKPKDYLGISSNWMWILNVIHSQTNVPVDHIYATLTKIRLDDTFKRIADQFGLSNSQIGRIFNKTVQILSHMLKTLIYAPPKKSVKKALPIPFRAYFSDAYAMIDAFEIEIEKPSNPLFQALSWSEYKKCNTLKYLVAATCDGTIIFVSEGYGGRISDVLLFEVCGVMNVLPEKCRIFVDRGFKQIDGILSQKNCGVIRPPSVSASSQPSKLEVVLTKRVASLRIHIERVIRRIREYKELKPHAALNLKMMPNIDNVVTVACALINLQDPIIRT